MTEETNAESPEDQGSASSHCSHAYWDSEVAKCIFCGAALGVRLPAKGKSIVICMSCNSTIVLQKIEDEPLSPDEIAECLCGRLLKDLSMMEGGLSVRWINVLAALSLALRNRGTEG